MRIPDWFIYLVVLVGIVYALTSSADRHPAPPAPPRNFEGFGTVLPAPSMFDEQVIVEGEVREGSSTGTAFALGQKGEWLTAKHVVDGCSDLVIPIGNRRSIKVTSYDIYENGDLALLKTDGGPDSLALDLDSELRVGQFGYHIGYPQAKPGEATSQLLSRSQLITRGRSATREPVLAWAEVGRTRGISGSLGGMSGGPVFDEDGEVVGVTVAESPRRGRIYTTAPRSLEAFVPEITNLDYSEVERQPISPKNYGGEADRLRRSLAVVQVICRS